MTVACSRDAKRDRHTLAVELTRLTDKGKNYRGDTKTAPGAGEIAQQVGVFSVHAKFPVPMLKLDMVKYTCNSRAIRKAEAGGHPKFKGRPVPGE